MVRRNIKIMQDGRHVFSCSKLADDFYNRDIGRMHFAGTYNSALFEDIA